MSYPKVTRDPDTHFDLVLESVDDDMFNYEYVVGGEGIKMYFDVEYDTKDHYDEWDGIHYSATAWVEYYLKDMGDVLNEITKDFWVGVMGMDVEFLDIDSAMPNEESDDMLLIGSKKLSIEAEYTTNDSGENDFEIFLEVCEEDSKMYEVIEDMSPPYEVNVEYDDYELDITSFDYNILGEAIREVFKMITELVESGDIDSVDMENFAFDFGENIILAYYKREFTDKEYILDLYKKWES